MIKEGLLDNEINREEVIIKASIIKKEVSLTLNEVLTDKNQLTWVLHDDYDLEENRDNKY